MKRNRLYAGMLLCLTGAVWLAPLTRAAAISATPQKQRRFELRGVVKSVDRPNRSATIRHEKIGNYMDAMTMPFLIKDARALQAMRPGDQITATLVSTDDGSQWLEQITILAAAARSAGG
ncbi:MAG: copper-binding protein [Blastocatellia bacterium]|nr:copper-binding protein [Blastocatellia bacterium]